MSAKQPLPKWLDDIERFLPIKSQMAITGNVKDRFHVPLPDAGGGLMTLREAVWAVLQRMGFTGMVTYDAVSGLGLHQESPDFRSWVEQTAGLSKPASGCYRVGEDALAGAIQAITRQRQRRVAVWIDYASRLIVQPENPDAGMQRFFLAMLKLSMEIGPFVAPMENVSLFNPVFWVAEQENDLPSWLALGNPRWRTIVVPAPDGATRRTVCLQLARMIPETAGAGAVGDEAFAGEFADATHGLLCRDLLAIAHLAEMRRIPRSRISDAVRQFKVGITDDPWERLDEKKIASGEQEIGKRVKGQRVAIQKAMDIVKRSVTGLSGAQASRKGGRPKGVLFLAGPTGTGKTELAKALTELIFGDQEAYIRFDMSEFSAEHADQRLLGAPPGYVGFDAGGELTNAIREKPFSLVLFDEIEKAHPRILDKFLQLLDDGVLTSGRGERVYFSEAIIVFTSNLGIYRKMPDGSRVANVSPGDPPEKVESEVRREIERYFKEEINRPELLNRIGENIVVFDFIREAVAGEIFEKMIGGIRTRMSEDRNLRLDFQDEALTEIRRRALANLDNGGRGIGNQIEALFINPLARALFELPGYGKDMRVTVSGYSEADGIPQLRIETSLSSHL